MRRPYCCCCHCHPLLLIGALHVASCGPGTPWPPAPRQPPGSRCGVHLGSVAVRAPAAKVRRQHMVARGSRQYMRRGTCCSAVGSSQQTVVAGGQKSEATIDLAPAVSHSHTRNIPACLTTHAPIHPPLTHLPSTHPTSTQPPTRPPTAHIPVSPTHLFFPRLSHPPLLPPAPCSPARRRTSPPGGAPCGPRRRRRRSRRRQQRPAPAPASAQML